MPLSVKKATENSVSRWLQKCLHTTNILQYPEEEFARFVFWFVDCHATDGPPKTGPPGPSVANYDAMDGPPGPSTAAIDGPPGPSVAP